MSKSLNTIQTLSKIGRVLSKIVFIICIVAAVLCFISIAALLAGIGTGELFSVGGVSISGIIEDNSGMSLAAMNWLIVVGALSCIGEAVVAKLAELYFRHELAAGTPFTFAGARELRRLGILSIVIPAACSLVTAIIGAIVGSGAADASNLSISMEVPIGMGITLLIFSVVMKYGAELTEQPGDAQIPEL